jgi:pyrroline-5-carboxylate reductase
MFKFFRKKIGIIGYGEMGSAIAERVKSGYSIYVFDKDKNKTAGLSGLKVAEDIQNLIKNADVVILAIKPQDFDSLLDEIKSCVKGKLLISIAAGIETSYIEKYLGNARVIRTMPNLPARINQGMTCLFKGEYASNGDLNFAEGIFNNLGKTLVLDNENMINAATAVSGSGPGFFCSLVEGKTEKEMMDFANNIFKPRLEQAAKENGFNDKEAYILASATTAGTLALVAKSNIPVQALCKQVTSPGGTTEAGLKELQKKAENLSNAVIAAKRRAEELSKTGSRT